MKIIQKEELGGIMPLFESFAKRAGFQEKMDIFGVFKSLEIGIDRGTVIIVINDDYSKFIYARLLSPELENKRRQIGFNAVWTPTDNDPWVREAVDFIIENVGKPRNAQEYYVNVYPKAKGLYQPISDRLTEYETANTLTI